MESKTQGLTPYWALDQVARHAQAIERERRQLLGAIRRARDAGASLRAIGKAACLSHQRIHQLLNEKTSPTAGSPASDEAPSPPPAKPLPNFIPLDDGW